LWPAEVTLQVGEIVQKHKGLQKYHGFDEDPDLLHMSCCQQKVLPESQHKALCDFSGESQCLPSLGQNGFLTPRTQEPGADTDAWYHSKGAPRQSDPGLGSISMGRGTYICESKEMQTSYQSSMASEEDRGSYRWARCAFCAFSMTTSHFMDPFLC
jgi:hypothetical protein